MIFLRKFVECVSLC